MSAEEDLLPLSVEMRDGSRTGLSGGRLTWSVRKMSSEKRWHRDVVDGSVHANEGKVRKNTNSAACDRWAKVIVADRCHGSG